MSNTSQGYTRKDFLRLSAATALSFGFAGMETSCFTLPVSELPALDRNKGIRIRKCNIVDMEQAKILLSNTITSNTITSKTITIGSLKPGKYADTVVLERNPLEDITACRNPLLVFKGGRIMFAAEGMKKEGTVVVV